MSLSGERTPHGPYLPGTPYGREPEVHRVDWEAVRAGHDLAREVRRSLAGLQSISAAALTAASTPLAELRVAAEGLYRVSYEDLAAAGVDLAKLAVGNGFPALGLTDTNNLFGALEFSDKLAEAGVQPIVGCSLQVDFGDRAQGGALQRGGANQPRSQPGGAVALLAADQRGYQNLMKLASCAFFDPAEDEPPHIEIERLQAHGEGLIALTGGPDGPIDRALREDQKDAAFERLKVLEKIFGDRLYVEIQRHGLKHEIEAEPMLLELAYARGLPIVATNEVYFGAPDDYEAHDALLCIAEGRYVVEDDRRRLSREHFFKTPGQMAELFADLPEAMQQRLDGLVARHHYGNRDVQSEEERTAASKLSDEQKAKMNWVRHPLVRSHPFVGKKSLYAISGSSYNIEGMTDDEGVDLLDELKEHSTQAKYCYTPTYKPGDVVIWDNCSLLHSAPLIDPNRPRTLWRITVKDKSPTIA